ncbi:MAG: hypothetical protein AAGE18_00730 [Pseudomonadota bacterium]
MRSVIVPAVIPAIVAAVITSIVPAVITSTIAAAAAAAAAVVISTVVSVVAIISVVAPVIVPAVISVVVPSIVAIIAVVAVVPTVIVVAIISAVVVIIVIIPTVIVVVVVVVVVIIIVVVPAAEAVAARIGAVGEAALAAGVVVTPVAARDVAQVLQRFGVIGEDVDPSVRGQHFDGKGEAAALPAVDQHAHVEQIALAHRVDIGQALTEAGELRTDPRATLRVGIDRPEAQQCRRQAQFRDPFHALLPTGQAKQIVAYNWLTGILRRLSGSRR